MFCKNKITECMGFVLARDIINNRIPIREICGRCALPILEMDKEQLNKIFSSIGVEV